MVGTMNPDEGYLVFSFALPIVGGLILFGIAWYISNLWAKIGMLR